MVVVVKGVVRRFHPASLMSEALLSFSELSQTGPAGCQLRVRLTSVASFAHGHLPEDWLGVCKSRTIQASVACIWSDEADGAVQVLVVVIPKRKAKAALRARSGSTALQRHPRFCRRGLGRPRCGRRSVWQGHCAPCGRGSARRVRHLRSGFPAGNLARPRPALPRCQPCPSRWYRAAGSLAWAHASRASYRAPDQGNGKRRQ